MKGKMRRSTKKNLLLTAIIFLIIAGCLAGIYFYLSYVFSNKYQGEINEKEAKILLNERAGYVAIADLSAGDTITFDNVEYQNFSASQPKEQFVGEEAIGKAVLIDVPIGAPITTSMIAEEIVENDIREMHFGEIKLFQNITSNSTCDVRISYPNGETYVILAKKMIRNVNEELTDCYIWLDPEEIDLISSAIVDAYLYEGTLFFTKYVQPTIQEESIVSYTPSLQTIELIKSDPNIVEISSQYLSSANRMQLENRMEEVLANENEEKEDKWSEEELKAQEELEKQTIEEEEINEQTTQTSDNSSLEQSKQENSKEPTKEPTKAPVEPTKAPEKESTGDDYFLDD